MDLRRIEAHMRVSEGKPGPDQARHWTHSARFSAPPSSAMACLNKGSRVSIEGLLARTNKFVGERGHDVRIPLCWARAPRGWNA